LPAVVAGAGAVVAATPAGPGQQVNLAKELAAARYLLAVVTGIEQQEMLHQEPADLL
jgi:hypothetical protein